MAYNSAAPCRVGDHVGRQLLTSRRTRVQFGRRMRTAASRRYPDCGRPPAGEISECQTGPLPRRYDSASPPSRGASAPGRLAGASPGPRATTATVRRACAPASREPRDGGPPDRDVAKRPRRPRRQQPGRRPWSAVSGRARPSKIRRRSDCWPPTHWTASCSSAARGRALCPAARHPALQPPVTRAARRSKAGSCARHQLAAASLKRRCVDPGRAFHFAASTSCPCIRCAQQYIGWQWRSFGSH